MMHQLHDDERDLRLDTRAILEAGVIPALLSLVHIPIPDGNDPPFPSQTASFVLNSLVCSGGEEEIRVTYADEIVSAGGVPLLEAAALEPVLHADYFVEILTAIANLSTSGYHINTQVATSLVSQILGSLRHRDLHCHLCALEAMLAGRDASDPVINAVVDAGGLLGCGGD